MPARSLLAAAVVTLAAACAPRQVGSPTTSSTENLDNPVFAGEGANDAPVPRIWCVDPVLADQFTIGGERVISTSDFGPTGALATCWGDAGNVPVFEPYPVPAPAERGGPAERAERPPID